MITESWLYAYALNLHAAYVVDFVSSFQWCEHIYLELIHVEHQLLFLKLLQQSEDVVCLTTAMLLCAQVTCVAVACSYITGEVHVRLSHSYKQKHRQKHESSLSRSFLRPRSLCQVHCVQTWCLLWPWSALKSNNTAPVRISQAVFHRHTLEVPLLKCWKPKCDSHLMTSCLIR